MTATITIIIALSVIVAAIPTIVAVALSTPPRQPATGRTSALIGLRGWHGCHLDAAGRTTWVDPVAQPTAAGALAAADAEMRRAGGAPPAVTA